MRHSRQIVKNYVGIAFVKINKIEGTNVDKKVLFTSINEART